MTMAVETAQNKQDTAAMDLMGLIDFSPWIFGCLENKKDLCLLA